MRTWFVLVMMAAVALSGCAGEEGAGFEPTSSTADDGAGGNSTADAIDDGTGAVDNGTGAAADLVPALDVTADVVNGTAPLLVTFTVAISNVTDAASWSFLVGDDILESGNETSFTFNHTFEAGTWNATFSVIDGGQQVEESLEITANEVVEETFQPVTMEHDIKTSCGHCILSDVTGASQCLGAQIGENGIDCAWFELDPSWQGRTIAVGGLFVPGMEFHPDCTGKSVISSTLDASTTIPDGAGCVFVMEFVDVVVTAKVTVS